MASAILDLGVDNSGFLAGMNEASRSAAGLERNLAGLFRRSPFTRAERSFAELAGNLATGNISGGLTTFAQRITGLGLGAAVAIGIAASTFRKFTQQASEAAEAVKKVQSELAKPFSAQVGLGAEGLTAVITAQEKALDNLVQKRGTTGAKIADFLSGPGGGVQNTPLATGLSAKDREIIKMFGLDYFRQHNAPSPITPGKKLTDSQAQEAIEKRIQQTINARADAEVEAVQAKIKGLQIGQLEGKLAQNALDARKRESEIILDEAQRRIGPGTDQRQDFINISKRIGATRDLAKAEDIADKNAATIKAAGTQAAQREADLDAKGISASEQKIAHLKNEIALIQQKLQLETRVEDRAEAQVQLTKAQTALRQEQFDLVSNPGKAAAEAGAAAVKAAQMRAVLPEGFSPRYPGDTVHRDMSGNIIPSPAYQTSPDAYNQTGGPMSRGQPTNWDSFNNAFGPPRTQPPYDSMRKAEATKEANRAITKDEMKDILSLYWGG